jgi:hypothetical protein
MKGFVGATGRSTWRPFGPERLDMSSSTCLKAEGLSTGLPAVFLEDLPVSPPLRQSARKTADKKDGE